MSPASMATLSVPPRRVLGGVRHRSGSGRGAPGRIDLTGEAQLAFPPDPAHPAGKVDPPLPAPSCHQRLELLTWHAVREPAGQPAAIAAVCSTRVRMAAGRAARLSACRAESPARAV